MIHTRRFERYVNKQYNRTLGTRRGGAQLLLFAVLIPLISCTQSGTDRLAAIKAKGELTVATSPGAATYYDSPEGPAGFEYDLAKAFADQLGVRLRVVTVNQPADALEQAAAGAVDIAAVGISTTQHAKLRFTPPYHEVTQQVVYRLGTNRPRNIAELPGREIEVPARSAYAARLADLRQEHPELRWLESNRRPEDLLQLVWEGLLEMTVADSHLIAVNRQFFPELQVAFNLGPPVPLSWAMRAGPDDTLYREASDFIAKQKSGGALAQLLERYYGPAGRSNFINVTVYRLRVDTRLPQYQTLFEEAGRRYGLDWRLLAAVAYQESFWDPEAVSPTGVRGFMMITQETARELGISNRLDAKESVDGGARYLRQLLDRIPERINWPDRMWFALAAYNVGISHLEDARILTQQQGADPDKWLDVKERLPLLADPKWYPKTKHGYARGLEPVRFVNRVRTYYDVLARIDDEERAKRVTEAFKLRAPAI